MPILHFLSEKIIVKEIIDYSKMNEDSVFADKNDAMELVWIPKMRNLSKQTIINQKKFSPHAGKMDIIIEGAEEAEQQPNTIKEVGHCLSPLFIEEESDEFVGRNRSEDDQPVISPIQGCLHYMLSVLCGILRLYCTIQDCAHLRRLIAKFHKKCHLQNPSLEVVKIMRHFLIRIKPVIIKLLLIDSS